MFGFFRSPTLSPRLLRLKDSALFASLTPLELKIVDGLMHERRYLADEIIFDEGEEGQALYVVMSGRNPTARRSRWRPAIPAGTRSRPSWWPR